VAGADYSIADMAIYPWYGGLINGTYGAAEFLSVEDYAHIKRWVTQLEAREGVKRGKLVNKPQGGLLERHDASDFAILPEFAPA
jgi:GST-like protein